MLGQYNQTLGDLTNQWNAGTGQLNSLNTQGQVANQTLGQITGQQQANLQGAQAATQQQAGNVGLAGMYNQQYGNMNSAINNTLNAGLVSGAKADTNTYGTLQTSANQANATIIPQIASAGSDIYKYGTTKGWW